MAPCSHALLQQVLNTLCLTLWWTLMPARLVPPLNLAALPLPAAPQLKVCTVPAAVSPAPLKTTPPGAATPPAAVGVKAPPAQPTPTPANKPTGAAPSTAKVAPLAVKGAISEDSGVAFLPSTSGTLKVSSSKKP
jgi:hypothetical protein